MPGASIGPGYKVINVRKINVSEISARKGNVSTETYRIRRSSWPDTRSRALGKRARRPCDKIQTHGASLTTPLAIPVANLVTLTNERGSHRETTDRTMEFDGIRECLMGSKPSQQGFSLCDIEST